MPFVVSLARRNPMEPSQESHGWDRRASPGNPVEAVIYCEDPVAPRLHRAAAAGFDWGIVLLAYAVFLMAFRFCGGQFILTKSNLLMFGAVLPVLGSFYGLMWVIAGTETAGMRWAGLNLTTFDGCLPERKQRLMRVAGSCLSLLTVIGMLWSFADEESLALSPLPADPKPPAMC
jgi:hypothetical protein